MITQIDSRTAGQRTQHIMIVSKPLPLHLNRIKKVQHITHKVMQVHDHPLPLTMKELTSLLFSVAANKVYAKMVQNTKSSRITSIDI